MYQLSHQITLIMSFKLSKPRFPQVKTREENGIHLIEWLGGLESMYGKVLSTVAWHPESV